MVSFAEAKCNEAICNFKYNHTCDGIQECRINVNIDSFFEVTKILIYLKIRTPENENDREFKRELIRTVVDVEKVIKGVFGNPVIQAITKDLLKSINFPLKFPFPPVRNCNYDDALG